MLGKVEGSACVRKTARLLSIFRALSNALGVFTSIDEDELLCRFGIFTVLLCAGCFHSVL